MGFEKITDSELESVGVEQLDHVPGLSPSAMKAKFEETAKKLLAPKFNKLVKALDGMDLQLAIKGGDSVLYLRVNEDKVLETSVDGETWGIHGQQRPPDPERERCTGRAAQSNAVYRCGSN